MSTRLLHPMTRILEAMPQSLHTFIPVAKDLKDSVRLFELYEGRHPLSILSSFFLELMLMYCSETQSLSMIRKIDQQCQQDVVVLFYDPRNGSAFRITLCAPRASRSPIGKKDDRMERIITPCGAGLEAGGWELWKWSRNH